MYADSKPCRVCGSEVELRVREVHEDDGTVAEPDGPVDERVCTNADCETNRSGRPADAPRP
jgi:hypothetical protein